MLDEKDMAMVAALLEKMKGGGSSTVNAPAPAENDYGARIDMLAEAVKVATDGNIKLAEKVCELEKAISVFAAFTSSWDSFARDKDRADGILALKGKHGEKYGKFEGAMKDLEGVDLWELLYDELSEARELAEKAGGTFDEDGTVSSIFDALDGKIKKYHEVGGKMITPPAPEPAKEEPKKEEVPSDDESDIPTAEAAEELGRSVGMRARERRIKK